MSKVRTEQDYLDAAPELRNSVDRRIDASGQINNWNLVYENDEYGTFPIAYALHFGKITRFIIDPRKDGDAGLTKTAQQQFDRKFGSGEIIDPEVSTNATNLSAASDQALQNATDACAIMGTLGGFDSDLQVSAAGAEEAAGDVLSATAEAAGIVAETNSKTITAVSETESLIAEAADLQTQLVNAGFTDLAFSLEIATDEVIDLLETSTNGLNQAVGETKADVGENIKTDVVTSGEAITAAATEIPELISPAKAGGCNTVADVLANLNVGPPGLAGILGAVIQSAVPQQSRMLDRSGKVVNVNIDKTLQYADIQYQGKLTRMYYQDNAKMLERFGTLGSRFGGDGTPQQVRRIEKDGSLVAFNIDRTKPFRDVIETVNVRNFDADADSGESLTTKETVPVRIYGDQALLDKFYPEGS